ncbi:MAG: methyltransferase domain-containing protein [Verrucomicrobia bacterium]|nr:methyltransferase domain-containing protein [Verrucomicrobiota bacterium]
MTAYFDGYAQKYGEVLNKSLKATGENQEYFARRRVEITGNLLAQRQATIARVVDFGCGLGTSAPHLAQHLQPKCIVGVDISREILKEAKFRNKLARVSFAHVEDFNGRADLVFCNGVFHHIAPAERRGALEVIRRILGNGGYLAFWENNPLNLGTRYIMSRCEFDRDAVVISPDEARVLLEANGFEIAQTRSAFFFPRLLAWMRGLEKSLASTLLGGQYLLLARPRERAPNTTA